MAITIIPSIAMHFKVGVVFWLCRGGLHEGMVGWVLRRADCRDKDGVSTSG